MNYLSLIKPILTLVIIITTQFLEVNPLKGVFFSVFIILLSLILPQKIRNSLLAIIVCLLLSFIIHPESNREKFLKLRSLSPSDLEGEAINIIAKIEQELPAKRSGERIFQINILNLGISKTKNLIEINIPDLPWRPEFYLSKGNYIKCFLDSNQLSKEFDIARSYIDGVIGRFYLSGKNYFCEILNKTDNKDINEITLVSKILDQVPSSSKRSIGVILAATIGNETNLDEGTRSIFKLTGLYHLLVVSGYHLTLFLTFSTLVSRVLIKKFPIFLLDYSSQFITSIVTILITISFLLIAEIGTPLVRATLMSSLLLLATGLRRKLALSETILWSLVFISILIPFSIFSISLQLSYSALIGVCSGGYVYNKVKDSIVLGNENKFNLDYNLTTVNKLYYFLLESSLISIGAFIFSLPVQLYWFGIFNPLSLLYNILFGFIFTFLVIIWGSASISVLIIIPMIGIPVMNLNSYFIELMLSAIEYLS